MKRILVIGGGSIGERHVRCFQRTARADVALCELNADLREAVRERYSLPAVYSSLDDALQDNFAAAVICTPAHLHVPMARQIAERGVSLLIEKPLSVDMDGIDDLKALIGSRGVSVSVAYTLRHHPGVCAIRDAVQSGRFGRALQIVSTSGQHFPFYRPAYRDIYYNRHETGGGAIQDALTHMVNAAEWLVGPITRLVADAEHCVLDGVDVEDTVHMITRHGNVLGSFNLNQYQAANETSLTVVCERGTIKLEFHNRRWLSCVEPDAPWTVEEEFALERDDLFVRQAAAFLDQLENRVAPACSLDEAHQTLRVNRAALESVRVGRWMNVNEE